MEKMGETEKMLLWAIDHYEGAVTPGDIRFWADRIQRLKQLLQRSEPSIRETSHRPGDPRAQAEKGKGI